MNIQGAGDAPPANTRQVDAKIDLTPAGGVGFAVGADCGPGLQCLAVEFQTFGLQRMGIESVGLPALVEGAQFVPVPRHAGVGRVGQWLQQIAENAAANLGAEPSVADATQFPVTQEFGGSDVAILEMRPAFVKGYRADHARPVEPVTVGFGTGIHGAGPVAKQCACEVFRYCASNIVNPAAMFFLQGEKAPVKIATSLGDIE